jgi:hypothetical protein
VAAGHRGRHGCAAIVANEVLGLGVHGLLLTSAAAWAVLAIPLWSCGKSALQHVVMFGPAPTRQSVVVRSSCRVGRPWWLNGEPCLPVGVDLHRPSGSELQVGLVQ